MTNQPWNAPKLTVKDWLITAGLLALLVGVLSELGWWGAAVVVVLVVGMAS
jgi:hypothetical protein